MKTYLFMRKDKNDKDGGKEFYFLGEMHPTQEYEQITIAQKKAVEITYELETPVEHGLYSYLTSSIDDEESEPVG